MLPLIEAFNKKYNFNKNHLTISNDQNKVKANEVYLDTLLNDEEVDYYDILESFLEELNFSKIKEYEESKVFTLGTYEIYVLKGYVCIKLQKTENKKIETSFYRTSENKWLNQDIPTGSCTDLNLFENIISMIRYLWK